MSGTRVLIKAAVVGGSVGSLLLISYNVIKYLSNRRTQPAPRTSASTMKKKVKSIPSEIVDCPATKSGEDLGPYFDEENGVDSSRLNKDKLNFYKRVRSDAKNSEDSDNDSTANSYCN